MKKSLLLIPIIVFSMGWLHSQIHFSDISAEAGVNNNGRNYGVSFADYDNDGDEDIFIARHHHPNILYSNNGDGTFIDVAQEAAVDYSGTANQGIWGDLDNDGDLDLYLANRDEDNILYQNNGDGTFTDITWTAGVWGDGRAKSVMFADVDADGWLDIYVANPYVDNFLYRNNGNMTFLNIVHWANANDNKIAMGSIFFDYDKDGDADLYLTHDANQAYILLQNDGTGRFTDVSEISGTDYSGMGMGVDVGDVNNDGWLDIYITNLSYNTLLLNNGDGTFSDISFDAAVTDPGMGWGTMFLDFDNDGFQDIYLANDSYFSPRPNVLYHNMGDNTFEIVSANTPLHSMQAGYGVACADVNNDGWLEIMLANSGLNDHNQLFENQNQNDHHWVVFDLEGTHSNRSAIGTQVEVKANGQTFVDEVIAGSGYAAQNSLKLHFGLGQAAIIDKVTIRWSRGNVEVFKNLAVDSHYKIVENESIVSSIKQVQEPIGATLSSITPNPFDNQALITLDLAVSQFISLQIIDLMGKTVQSLAEGKHVKGQHFFEWDAKNQAGQKVAKGIYFCRLETLEGVAIRKLIFC